MFTIFAKDDGTILTTQDEFEQEVMHFYCNLMGKEADKIQHINIEAMREGPQINMKQR